MALYSWITFAQAKTALARRLDDANKVFDQRLQIDSVFDDIKDRFLTNAKLPRQITLFYLLYQVQLSYGSSILWGKFPISGYPAFVRCSQFCFVLKLEGATCVSMAARYSSWFSLPTVFVTLLHQSKLCCVFHIFLVCYVFKIFWCVIRFHTVLMIDDESWRTWPKKSSSYERMDSWLTFLEVSIQGNKWISLLIRTWVEQDQASDPSKSRSLIETFVSWNVSPLFFMSEIRNTVHTFRHSKRTPFLKFLKEAYL